MEEVGDKTGPGLDLDKAKDIVTDSSLAHETCEVC